MEQHAAKNRLYTVEEYFRHEADSSERYEYRDGEILAMAGGTESHSLIIANVIRELGNRLKGLPCRVYDSNLRVRADRTLRYTYPDALVVCGATEFDPADTSRTTVTNAKVIVEVLSPSTERSDRGEKFERYILSPSLQEYVLIAQDKPRVQTFLRQADGAWLFAYFDGLDAVARLRSLNVELPLGEIYQAVEFPPPAPASASDSEDKLSQSLAQ